VFFEEAVEHLSEEKRALLFETVGRGCVGFYGIVFVNMGRRRG
jgi:hypothetical protein